MEAVAGAYEYPSEDDAGGDSCADQKKEHAKLNFIAEEFGMTPLKVRKLLVTEGYLYQREVYSAPVSRNVNDLYNQGKNIAEIMELTGLSRAPVHGYLPYSKAVYKTKKISVAAGRIKLYRDRNDACERLQAAIQLQKPAREQETTNLCLTASQTLSHGTASGILTHLQMRKPLWRVCFWR